MFDEAQLRTAGVIFVSVTHPRTLRTVDLDFCISATHQPPVLGMAAYLQFELLSIVHENICDGVNERNAFAIGVKQDSETFDAISQVVPEAASEKTTASQNCVAGGLVDAISSEESRQMAPSADNEKSTASEKCVLGLCELMAA